MAALPATISLKRARELLGVGPGATPAELRRAYCAAAKRLHPDVPGGDTAAFQRASTAYERLRAAPGVRPAASRPVLEVPLSVALHGGAVEALAPDGRRLRLKLPAGVRTGSVVRAGQTRFRAVVRAEAGTAPREEHSATAEALRRRFQAAWAA